MPFLGLLFIILLAAAKRWSWNTWFTAGFAWLLGCAVLMEGEPGLSWYFLVSFWLLGGALLGLPLLRKPLLSSPLLKAFKKKLPPLTDTEKTALNAGSVGFEAGLLSGRPDWASLFETPSDEITEEERAFLSGPVEVLCSMIDDWDITHVRADLPPEIWDFLKRHGFFGMIIPKEYGGLGFSPLAHHKVIKKLSSVSSVVSSTVAVPNSLGPAELLLHYGSDDQKSYYLPRLACGEDIPCFALTGPFAGSDATSIPDVGVVCRGRWKGETVVGVRLTFDKRYITLAPIATLIGLAFQMQDPDGLLGDSPDIGISLALLPRDTPGLEIGRRHFPLNVPFQNGPLRGRDVFLPLSYLIGGPAMAGQGWRMLMECLSVGRAITLPSTAAGSASMAALAVGSYARIRKQFGLSIGKFDGVQELLSRLASNAYAVTGLSHATACAVHRGDNPAVPSAIAKYHCTERARLASQDSMDILGGKGIILGPQNFVGRGWQGSPIAITVEGANVMTRSLMIFGQGVMLCHPWLMKEFRALSESNGGKSLYEFDDVIWKHAADFLGNTSKTLFSGLTKSSFGSTPGSESTKKWLLRLGHYSSALAIVSDVSLALLGGKLKFNEFLSGRLGDILSHLYLSSHLLRQYEERGCPEEEKVLLDYTLTDSVYKIEAAFKGVLLNFPSSKISWVLARIIFPYGYQAKPPSDNLVKKVANLLLQPSTLRAWMGEDLYLTPGPHHPAGRIISYLESVIAASALENKIRDCSKELRLGHLTKDQQVRELFARGRLLTEEVRQFEDLQAMILDTINVDDFAPDELPAGVYS